jgi:hypothetical protein
MNWIVNLLFCSVVWENNVLHSIVLLNYLDDRTHLSSIDAFYNGFCSYCIEKTINIRCVLLSLFLQYLIYVMITASWAISVYFAYQRTWKPFNPILGETYELTNHNGITFLAEQVSFQLVILICALWCRKFSLCVCLVQFHNQTFCLIHN